MKTFNKYLIENTITISINIRKFYTGVKFSNVNTDSDSVLD